MKIALDGREQVLRYVGPAETFNEIGVFADRPAPATAITLEPACIWLLPRASVLQLLRNHPAFAQRVIETMADRVLNLVALVTDLALRSVTARLAHRACRR